MAIPKAKFIGLSSADSDVYSLPRTVGIKLNQEHVSWAKELLKCPWFQKKPWKEEIKRMRASGRKRELLDTARADSHCWASALGHASDRPRSSGRDTSGSGRRC
jgi:DNA topoisomerase-6 subunit A